MSVWSFYQEEVNVPPRRPNHGQTGEVLLIWHPLYADETGSENQSITYYKNRQK